MLELLKLFNHAIQINRTHEEIRDLQDAFMVLDAQHYLRRPVAESTAARSSCTDENRRRRCARAYPEIWTASYRGSSTTWTVGRRFFSSRQPSLLPAWTGRSSPPRSPSRRRARAQLGPVVVLRQVRGKHVLEFRASSARAAAPPAGWTGAERPVMRAFSHFGYSPPQIMSSVVVVSSTSASAARKRRSTCAVSADVV
jgi:hypothetical protein